MKSSAATIAGFLGAAALAADNVPLTNWTVPPYRSSAGPNGAVSAMTDISSPVAFVPVIPCRLVDTRAGSGFPAGYGPPSLSPGVPRSFDLNSQIHCPGLPAEVEAYSLNVTVTNTSGPGHLVIYPEGQPQPTVSSLNYQAGQTIPNALIAPAGNSEAVVVVAGVSATDVIIDINGYFTDIHNPGQRFIVEAEVENDAVIVGINTFSSGTQSVGVRGYVSGQGTGVYGTSLDGIGVHGFATGGNANAGVTGTTASAASTASGVLGVAQNSNGAVYGVHGFSFSDAVNSAGVRGVGDVAPNTSAQTFSKTGIRGESRNGYGVLGLSETRGTSGVLLDGNGSFLAAGHLGREFFAPPGGPNWGVFADGDIGATGTKHFLDPHPTDPSKAISYVSLEGPEAGTYFRGRGKFQNGIARIAVPEHFRLVTDPEGLTVQITPLGGMATFGVVRADLDEVVVLCSRNLEFYYLVQGVRSTFKDLDPVVSGSPFLPESAEQKLPAYLSEAQKKRLIDNGTYNADGTVNRETARRLGLDRGWAERPPLAK